MSERFEYVEKCRVVLLIDMVLIPEARPTHLLTRASITEPICRGRIERRLREVAQQCDGIPLHHPALTARTWLIIDRYPDDAHPAEVFADLTFHFCFERSDTSGRVASLAPTRRSIRRIGEKRGTDEQTEDRSAMITTALTGVASVLGKPLP